VIRLRICSTSLRLAISPDMKARLHAGQVIALRLGGQHHAPRGRYQRRDGYSLVGEAFEEGLRLEAALEHQAGCRDTTNGMTVLHQPPNEVPMQTRTESLAIDAAIDVAAGLNGAEGSRHGCARRPFGRPVEPDDSTMATGSSGLPLIEHRLVGAALCNA
jgi:hypothetical protein